MIEILLFRNMSQWGFQRRDYPPHKDNYSGIDGFPPIGAMVGAQRAEEKMTKHVLDRGRSKRESALVKAVETLEKGQPKPATLTLQRRVRSRDGSQRQAQFLRVAREQAAGQA
jgi:hypothetical protein